VEAISTDKMSVLPPVGTNYEFTKDGKVKLYGNVGEKVERGGEGTTK